MQRNQKFNYDSYGLCLIASMSEYEEIRLEASRRKAPLVILLSFSFINFTGPLVFWLLSDYIDSSHWIDLTSLAWAYSTRFSIDLGGLGLSEFAYLICLVTVFPFGLLFGFLQSVSYYRMALLVGKYRRVGIISVAWTIFLCAMFILVLQYLLFGERIFLSPQGDVLEGIFRWPGVFIVAFASFLMIGFLTFSLCAGTMKLVYQFGERVGG